MNIKLTKREEKPKGKTFADVGVEEWFYSDLGRLMIKRDRVQVGGVWFNAVNLCAGTLVAFADDAHVTILKGVAVVYSEVE